MDRGVTIIIPFFNEAETLPRTCQELRNIMDTIGLPYTLLFVDDGSCDQGIESLSGPNIHIIKLAKNYGQASALLAGISQAKTEYVLSFDADLEYSVKALPRFVEKLEQGYDMVVGVRSPMRKSLVRRVLEGLTCLKLGRSLSDVFCPLKGASLKLRENFSPHVFPDLELIKLASKVAQVEVERVGRRNGKSKYTFLRKSGQALALLVYLASNWAPVAQYEIVRFRD